MGDFEDDWAVSKKMDSELPIFLNWEIRSVVVYRSKRGMTVRVVFEEKED